MSPQTEVSLTLLFTQVSGIQANYKPVSSFGHFGFDDELIKAILKMEFTQPTPIQAQVGLSLCGYFRSLHSLHTGTGTSGVSTISMLVSRNHLGEINKYQSSIEQNYISDHLPVSQLLLRHCLVLA